MVAPRQITTADLVPLIAGNAQDGFSGLAPTALPYWRKGRGRVLQGIGRCTFLDVGDSTSAGATKQVAPSRIMSNLLSKAGINTCNASSFGSAGTGGGATLTTYDSRWTFGSGWTNYSFPTVGGLCQGSATVNSKASFAPGETVNQFTVYYIAGTGTKSMTVDIDGATSGSGFQQVNTASTSLLKSAVVSVGTSGLHTLNITVVDGLIVIVGVIGRDTATSAVDVINLGWSGSTSINWNSSVSAWSPVPAIAALQPDVTRINLGINDWDVAHQTGLPAFTANITAIATSAAATGDVFFTLPFPSATTIAAQSIQDSFRSAIRGVAAQFNAPVMDLQNRFVSNSVAYAQGLANSDGYHPPSPGFADIGVAMARLLSI